MSEMSKDDLVASLKESLKDSLSVRVFVSIRETSISVDVELLLDDTVIAKDADTDSIWLPGADV